MNRNTKSNNEKMIIARFRCDNEEMENRYRMDEEKSKCRLCEGRKTIKHMMSECMKLMESEERIKM